MGQYPLSKYHFIVEWGGGKTSFTEVSGLSLELAVVEHRSGDAREHSTVKMPGLKKFGNIVLKRGIQAGDKDFFNWINTIQLNQVERRNVTISLLNESHEPIMVWRIRNAWPCKYVVGDLNASSNEVLIEMIELAHEGLSLETV